MSALGCWSLSRNMWTPITSLETETFYKYLTIVMKKCYFFLKKKSSTMVISVIIYIMDCILAIFVSWFNMFVSFCSLFCLYIYQLTDGIFKSLSLWVYRFTANWLSFQILVRQHKAASCYFRGRCCQLFCIDTSSWEQRQISVSSIAYRVSF